MENQRENALIRLNFIITLHPTFSVWKDRTKPEGRKRWLKTVLRNFSQTSSRKYPRASGLGRESLGVKVGGKVNLSLELIFPGFWLMLHQIHLCWAFITPYNNWTELKPYTTATETRAHRVYHHFPFTLPVLSTSRIYPSSVQGVRKNRSKQLKHNPHPNIVASSTAQSTLTRLLIDNDFSMEWLLLCIELWGQLCEKKHEEQGKKSCHV